MKFRTTWITMTALCACVAMVSAQEPAAKPSDAQNKTAAADNKSEPAQSAQTKSEAAPQDAATTTAAKGTIADDPDYVIGVEDSLMINVWHEPEISKAVTVRPDGKISLPLLGDIEADGKTPKQLQVDLHKRLEALLKSPEVTVIVQEARSQKFNILGEVNHPGVFPLTQPITVLDAIALGGGFRDFAKTKKMYILRRHKDGTTTKIPVNYNDLIKGTVSDKNFEIQARDTIVVP